MNPKFKFESQFSNPLEYYKSYLVLRKLNEKIKLTKFHYNCDNLEELVQFCKANKLEITGAEIQKHTFTGGNKISSSDMASILKEKLNIESDGTIYNYSIADNKLGMAASIICIKDPSEPEGCITMTDKEFGRFMDSEGLEYYFTPEEDEKIDPEKSKPRIVFSELFFSASKVVISNIRHDTWEYIDFINKPADSSEYEWILHNPELQKFKNDGLKIDPIIRISPVVMTNAFDKSDVFQSIRTFDVPINSFMMQCQEEAMEDNVPDGICLNCFGNDFSTGDLVLCINCDSNIILFLDDNFPWADEMEEEIESYADKLWGFITLY